MTIVSVSPSANRVVCIRLGQETYPIDKNPHMLRLLENLVRTSRTSDQAVPPPQP